jgi:hypothetical protein
MAFVAGLLPQLGQARGPNLQAAMITQGKVRDPGTENNAGQYSDAAHLLLYCSAWPSPSICR